MTNRKKIGLFLIISPFLITIFVFISFAFVNTLLGASSVEVGSQSLGSLIKTVLNFSLSLVGFIATLGILVGCPTGIYLLCSKGRDVSKTYDKRSGKGYASAIPEEIRGWNWGAAGLTWIWGLSNGVWISLLTFVPLLGYFFWIFLGIKGNEWAWRKSEWESIEAFKSSQKAWKIWGIVFLSIRLGIILITMLGVLAIILSPADSTKSMSSTDSTAESKVVDLATVSGESVNYKISYDANTWTANKSVAGGVSEFEFGHVDGDVYAMVIAERIEIPLETLKDLAIQNLQSVDPSVEIVQENYKTINGRNFLVREMSATINGIPLTYYGYYYGGSEGAIQFIAYTSPSLFLEYKTDLDTLLSSLTILTF